MSTEQKKNMDIDFGKIFKDLLKHKSLYYKVLPLAFVLAAIYALSLPNYYNCTVKLAPELGSNAKAGGGLAGLASSFGINLGGTSSGSDAINPTLYPDLMSSVDFKASIFNIKVRPEDSDQEYTYYEYLKEIKKRPWWIKGKMAILDWLKASDNDSQIINPRRLTKEQTEMAKVIGRLITCQVDKKTMVITLSVEDTSPEVCTTMADSTMALLQKYITDYRTSKARVDLEYNKKLLVEAKSNYEKASRAYAQYSDANLHTFQEKIRQKKTEMETEVNLQRAVYQQVAAQLQQAEMKLQEDTPAFAVIQASTIPAKKSGPTRAINCFFVVFLAFIITSIYILYKEGNFKPSDN